jgi:hypothetical protein
MQVDVDVGDWFQSVRHLILELAQEAPEASLVVGDQARGHHEDALLELVADLAVLGKRGVLRHGQGTDGWHRKAMTLLL